MRHRRVFLWLAISISRSPGRYCSKNFQIWRASALDSENARHRMFNTAPRLFLVRLEPHPNLEILQVWFLKFNFHIFRHQNNFLLKIFFTLGNQENNLLGLVALRKRPLLMSLIIAQGFGAARLLRPRRCFLISCAMFWKYKPSKDFIIAYYVHSLWISRLK